MKWDIYYSLKKDPDISAHVKNEIKFYEYPPTNSVEGIYIVIDPLDVPRPDDYADNQPLTDDYLFQIEVWGKDGSKVEEVAKTVRKVMGSIGFTQGSGVDEWDKETEVFRDARRYEGKFYDVKII
ncbi:DUF3168 domain-containing protein [Halobacillus litoralis]|uniref:tail completion protein gp17 n=1 Tax=Halobacillus litoralis TaxID=45668 RepID=UPI001CD601F1|nr:DUF3168 domain-containing protein [Halobacillus litoralis]MCA1021795.1 DUF3168 domain-containing protein [Halobacillus litoralis]